MVKKKKKKNEMHLHHEAEKISTLPLDQPKMGSLKKFSPLTWN